MNEKKKSRAVRLRRELPFHLMLLPAVILVGIFSYGPMVGIIMAFEKFSPKKGIFGSPFVGLENFRYLMNIPDIDKVVFNTFFIAAMKLALAWYKATNGKGEKDMVVLPYKDALVLFSKYLQQLIMESLGKRLDLDGNEVCQGISVYGNKGSTDQHAYVQQLRDGVNNFFATFIEVRECSADAVEVEAGATCGDFLQGFLRGTRQALAESGRSSITISIPEVNAKTLGMLIALFERAVSFYASLVNINAYHQPGVEAGKKAAGTFLALLGKVRAALGSTPETAAQVAARLDADQEAVYHCLVHIASSDSSVKWVQAACADEDTFCKA